MKRPLLAVCISYILGILLHKYVPFYVILICAVLIFASAMVVFKQKIFLSIALIAFLSFGFIYSKYADNIKRSNLAEFQGGTAKMDAIFIDDIKKDNKSYTFLAKISNVGDIDASGEKTRVTLYSENVRNLNLEYGDKIQFNGTIDIPDGERNPGGFDYRQYLLTKKIYAVTKIKDGYIKKTGKNNLNIIIKFSYKIRNNILKIINESLPKSQAAILEGIVLSKTDSIDDETKTDFSNSGLTHLMAVSGMNVAYLVLPLLFIFRKLKLKDYILVPVVSSILVIFAIITGAGSSVIRAVIMSIIILFGKMINRKSEILTSISASAIAILLYNPLGLYDIGFQLSFVATLSIVLFYSKIKDYLRFLPKFISEAAAVTISAQIGVNPIIVYNFNKLSIVSLLTNILAGPLSGIILVLGLLMSIGGQISLVISKILGWLNYYLINLLILIVQKSVIIPFSYVNIPTPRLSWIMLYYIIVFSIFCYPQIYIKIFNKNTLKYAISATTLFILTAGFIPKPLEVTFIDVGQGDSAFIRTPNNKTILIDSGGSVDSDFDVGGKIVVPFLLDKGIRKVDIIVLTHTDADHIEGFKSIVNHLKVGTAIINTETDLKKMPDVLEALERNNIKIVPISFGSKIDLGKNVYLKSYGLNGADNDNDNSVILQLVYRNNRFLFTGDASENVEKKLLKYQEMASDVLKVAHHGSKYSTSPEFLNLIKPKIAVLSVGKNNSYGHPDKNVVQRLLDDKVDVFRTDKQGCITMYSYGKYIEIKTISGVKKKYEL